MSLFRYSSAFRSGAYRGRKNNSYPRIRHASAPKPSVVKKVKKLSEIAEELLQGKHFPVTRFTIRKISLEPDAAAAFALFLAQERKKHAAKESPDLSGTLGSSRHEVETLSDRSFG